MNDLNKGEIESDEFIRLISETKEVKFCNSKEVLSYKDLINNPKIKKIYQEGITESLKKVFKDYWVESTEQDMSGLYGIEIKHGRSMLNNLNTNYNTFCLITKSINAQLTLQEREVEIFNFLKKENKTVEEVVRLVGVMDSMRETIFSKDNEDFINTMRVLKKLWDRGQKSEKTVTKKLENHFKGSVKIEQIGGHGKKEDAIKGVDLKIALNDIEHTAQVKPFDRMIKEKGRIKILGSAYVGYYKTDWFIFIQPQTSKIFIFKNKPVTANGVYIFNVDSLLYEIG
jgi:hypothetical protein